MAELSLEEFMRAFTFARAVKKTRPREDFYTLLVDRLGAMIFWHEARLALPLLEICDLNWIVLPGHVAATSIDLRINGWKIDVKTAGRRTVLDWPGCKRCDVFPKVAIEERAIKELAARYRRPKQSTPVGLLDDPIVEVSGSVVGWIGIGTAERLAEDDALVSTVDDKLATTESLWSLLAATRGPSIKQADAAWQLGRGETPITPSWGRRVAAKPEPLLLPPRRTPRAASAA